MHFMPSKINLWQVFNIVISHLAQRRTSAQQPIPTLRDQLTATV